MKPDYKTFNGCCDNTDDAQALRDALGEDYKVLYDDGYSEGYGHHGYNAVFELADGRYIHAECGGCSCSGYGSWSYCESREEALKLIPEQERKELS